MTLIEQQLKALEQERDQALKERDEARANFNEACDANARIAKERDALRAEQDALLKARINALANTTPEPSRLEIAARIMQGWAAAPGGFNLRGFQEDALEVADALIAAAKEVQT